MKQQEGSNYYNILDVSEGSSQNEILAAYYRAKSTFSEDSVAIYSLYTSEEIQNMRELIDEAFLVLNNREKRQAYDFFLRRDAVFAGENTFLKPSTVAFNTNLNSQELNKYIKEDVLKETPRELDNFSSSGITLQEEFDDKLILPGRDSVVSHQAGAVPKVQPTGFEATPSEQVADAGLIPKEDLSLPKNKLLKVVPPLSRNKSVPKSNTEASLPDQKDAVNFKMSSGSQARIKIGLFAEPSNNSSSMSGPSKASMFAEAKVQDVSQQNSINSFDQNWTRDVSLAKSKEYFQQSNYQYNEQIEQKIQNEKHYTGAFFRLIREYKNISIDQVSFKTKISVKNLECIEQEDFSNLPANVFLRGFLQQYCKVLGLSNEGVNSYLAKAKS